MKKILQRENDTLRKISKSVSVQDIGSEKIEKVLTEMKEALSEHEDGVALAAPQIGYLLRIFIVSENIFSDPELGGPIDTEQNCIYINPEIIKESRKKEWTPEGCLSVRWSYGEVNRSEKITIEAYDKNGKQFKRGASGILAQIFQHEIDHLDGILFIDKARNIREVPPDE